MENIHKEMLEKKKTSYAEFVDEARKEAGVWVDHAEGRNEDAIRSLRNIAQREEAVGDEPIGIPAREMLADLLLEIKRPEQALTEYEADLKFNPNRFNGLYGAAQAAEMSGKTEKANSYYAQVLKVCNGSSSDRPELSRAKALVAQK
jgi:tetratricopeptide (TPR) repeat protein